MISKIQIKISFCTNYLDVFANWPFFSCPGQSRTAHSFVRRRKNKRRESKGLWGRACSLRHTTPTSFGCAGPEITLWGGRFESNCRVRKHFRLSVWQRTIEIGRILTQHLSRLIPKAKCFSIYRVNYQKGVRLTCGSYIFMEVQKQNKAENRMFSGPGQETGNTVADLFWPRNLK